MLCIRNNNLLFFSALFIIGAEIVSRFMRDVYNLNPDSFTFLGPLNIPKAVFSLFFIITCIIVGRGNNYLVKKIVNLTFILILLGFQMHIAYIDYKAVHNIYAYLGGLWVASIGAVMTNRQIIMILLPYIIIYLLIIDYNYSEVVTAGYDRLYAVFFTTVSYCISRMIFSFTAKSYLNDIYLNDSKSKLEEAVKELESLSITDQLTGIYNRRGFEKSLKQLIVPAILSKQPVSIIMIDIDYFKYYNDFYGHPQGDVCLKLVAQAMIESLDDKRITFCRYGGEEFIIAISNMSNEEVVSVSKKLKLEIEKLGIPHDKSLVGKYVSVTLGVATTILNDYKEVYELISQADRMLYKGKNEGRNRISNWEGDLIQQ